MDYITTTDLRTKSSQLIDALEKGMEVSLIHRSQLVAIIKPKSKMKPLKNTDIVELKELAKSANLPKMSYDDRKRAYTEHLLKKYGKDIS